MNKQKPKVNNIDLGELDSKEAELLHYIRTRFRYGDLVIETRDGLPFRIKKMTEFQTLE